MATLALAGLLGFAGGVCAAQDETSPPPPERETRACLYLGTGQGKEADAERAGLQGLHGELEELGIATEVMGWGRGVVSFLFPRRSPERCQYPEARTLMVGYSLGARAALKEARKNEDYEVDVLFLIAPMGTKRIRIPENVRLAVVVDLEGDDAEVRHPKTELVRLRLLPEIEEEGWWKLAPGSGKLRNHMKVDNHPVPHDLLLWMAERCAAGACPDGETTGREAGRLMAQHLAAQSEEEETPGTRSELAE